MLEWPAQSPMEIARSGRTRRAGFPAQRDEDQKAEGRAS